MWPKNGFGYLTIVAVLKFVFKLISSFENLTPGHSVCREFSMIFKFNLALVFAIKNWRMILSKNSACQPWINCYNTNLNYRLDYQENQSYSKTSLKKLPIKVFQLLCCFNGFILFFQMLVASFNGLYLFITQLHVIQWYNEHH